MSNILPPDDLEEYEAYIRELLSEYRRLIDNIGKNGLAAPMLLHYRDELHETLGILMDQEDIAPFLEPYLEELEKLDDKLLERASDFLKELGGIRKLMHYRWSVKPSTDRWWWYLEKHVNKEVLKESPTPSPLRSLWDGISRWLTS